MANPGMTNKRLMQAVIWISIYEGGKDLNSIQFEDGSGNNFNYIIAGENEWRFISWRRLCEGLGYNPDNLVTTAS